MIISPNKKKYTNLEKKYLKFETSNMSPFIKIKWKRANKFYMFDVENKKYIEYNGPRDNRSLYKWMSSMCPKNKKPTKKITKKATKKVNNKKTRRRKN